MQKYLSSKISDLIIKIVTINYFSVRQEIRKVVVKNYYSILDIGCGTGTLATMFRPKGYFGFDIDKPLVEYASERYKNYKFGVGDATNFHLGKKFDYVVVVGVIHHLNDSQSRRVFLNISKHLKDSGKALVIEAIPPICKYNLIGKLIRNLDKGDHVRKLSEYKKLSGVLNLEKSYSKKGGIVDYGVMLFGSKKNKGK